MPDIAETLIEATRAATRLKERESVWHFIAYWAALALAAVGPVAIALVVNSAVLSGVESDCWTTANGASAQTTCAAEAPPSDPVRSLTGRIGSVGVTLELRETRQTAPSDIPVADVEGDHARYRARATFATALLFYWTVGGAILYTQLVTCHRQWRTASFDRCDNDRFVLRKRPLDGLVLLVGVSSGLAAAALTDLGFRSVLVGAAGFVVQALIGRRCARRGQPAPQNTAQAPRQRPSQSDLSNAPLAVLPLTVTTGLTLGGLLLRLLPDWVLPFVPADPLGGLGTGIFAASVALLFSVIVTSGMLITSLGREMPPRHRACAIAKTVLDDPYQAGRLSGALWQKMLDHVQGWIDTQCTVAAVTFAGDTAQRARERFPPNPSFSLSRAKTFDRMVRIATLPLALTMAAALVTLGLGMDLLGFDPGAAAEEAAARNQSEAALIVLLGLGLTVSLALLAVPALVRLDVFIDKTESPPASDYHISGKARTLAGILHGTAKTDDAADLLRLSKTPRSKVSGVKDTARKTFRFVQRIDGRFDTRGHPDAEDLAEVVLRRHLGAGQKKFADILQANDAFGAFQDVLGADLKKQALAIATALAPVAFPTLIELLT